MTPAADTLMAGYRDRTNGGKRYLWTDAFAVCNYLALGQRDHARALVDRVHHVLGRHRPDDPRRGWLSGLAEAEGEQHPTSGGLRIGKPLPERSLVEPFDEQLEWQRDGQYFHYLTKWMHALARIGERRWAVELAGVAHERFTHPRGLYWKMTVDLTRPLVRSTGQHDPLDGLVTCLALDPERLAGAIAELARMVDVDGLVTADPLGIGGLLVDAHRLTALRVRADLVESILVAALRGLEHYTRRGELQRPAEDRLAFRELGLAIGLAAFARIDRARLSPAARAAYTAMAHGVTLGDELVKFWLEPAARATASWQAHRDINDVMLATALVPDGFLGNIPA